jgi:hypothetical protein
LSIFSGILAWEWTSPDGSFSALLYLILWGILSRISHFIAFGILMTIFK